MSNLDLSHFVSEDFCIQCVCVYICICTSVCLGTHILSACVCMFVVRTQRMHTHTHACRTHATHARTRMHARMQAHTHTRTHAHTHACMHACICMHACTYVGTHAHGCLSHIVSVLQEHAAANMPRVLQELVVGSDNNVINASEECVANQHTARVHIQDASSP